MLPAWAPLSLAQESQPADSSEAETASEPEQRRIRRLGDVEAEEYEFDLSLPEMPSQPAAQSPAYALPDSLQNARLQQLLQTLAARPGDEEALDDLEVLLDQVVEDANALMSRRDFEDAAVLLGVVRNVDPRKEGLDDALERLSAYRDARYPYEPPVSTGKKLNTVQSLSPLQLPDPRQLERLEVLLANLAARPASSATQRELAELLDDLLNQANQAAKEGKFEQSEQILKTVRTINPRKRGLSEAREELEDQRQVRKWLSQAEQAERQGLLFEPLIDSAYYFYRKALAIDPANEKVQAGLSSIQNAMIDNAMAAARNFDSELTQAWLKEAAAVREDQRPVIQAREQIDQLMDTTADDIEMSIRQAIGRGDFRYAEFKIVDLIALGGYEERVTRLRGLMNREQEYGQYEPGQVVQDRFRDFAGTAPAVLVIGSGSFLMGSTERDRDFDDNEAPQRRVTIQRAFGLGLREITVGQFRDFVRQAAYRTEAERLGRSSVWDDNLGRLTERSGVSWRMDYAGQPAEMNHPVVHVSWNDAQAYVEWLSRATGARYRLPSEAEFEYALRAGTRSNYWWGDSRPRSTVENLAGDRDESESGRNFSNFFRGYSDGYWGPAPVGSFEPNPWGFLDMAGNVSEWVQDCWHPNYTRAPNSAAAWENPGCERRVVRGGYWASRPEQSRSAYRTSAPNDLKAPQLGFRVVREL